jgi:hypothetical protein
MNKILLFILAFTFTSISYAQNFLNYYGYGYFFDCGQTRDSNFIAAGSEVYKIDQPGDTIWTCTVSSCVANAILETEAGEYIITGYRTYNQGGSGHEPRIAKIDASGHEVWSKPLITPYTDEGYGRDIILNHHGNYYLTWEEQYHPDMTIIETDTSGNILWSRKYNQFNSENSIALDIDGYDNIYLTGTNYDSASQYYGFVSRIDSSGNLVSGKLLNHTLASETYLNDIFYLNDSSIYVVGNLSLIPNNSGTRLWIARLNSNLDTLKSVVLDKEARGIRICYDSASAQLYFLANGSYPGDTNRYVNIIRSDLTLSDFYQKNITPGLTPNSGYSIKILNDSRLLICGTLQYSYEKWLLTTDTSGFMPLSAVTTGIINLPDQVQANSFYSNGKLQFYSSEKIKTVSIFTISGERILSLRTNAAPGEIDCSMIPAGIYIAEFSGNKNVCRSEFVILK